MGRLIRLKDWSETPLGPIDLWPSSLGTAVSIVLNLNVTISLAWDPEHVLIYNDGDGPICRERHTKSMGQDAGARYKNASAIDRICDEVKSFDYRVLQKCCSQ